MSQPYLSLERAKTLIVEIVEDSPRGKRNPQTEGSCTYDDGKGNHCIIGELFIRAGLPHLHTGDNGIRGVTRYSEKGYTSQDTLDRLDKVQHIFDGQCFAGVTPTWRQALKECRKRGLL